MENIYKMKLRTSKNRVHQTDARKFKDELHEILMEKIGELDYDITPVDNGFIIEVQHEELGAIPVEAKFIVKPLDYDVISAGEQYAEKQRDKNDKK